MVNGLLVRPDVANAQFAADRAAAATEPLIVSGGTAGGNGAVSPFVEPGTPGKAPEHFFLRVRANDVTKLPRVATQLANDIVAHLASIGGASVEVSIEVKADVSGGINAQLEERLRKNAAAHQFPDPEFNQ